MGVGLNKTGRINRGETSSQLVVWLVLLSAFYLLRDIWTVALPDIVFTGLCAMAFLFLSPGSAMGVYMFTSALSVPDFEIRIVYLAVLIVKFLLRRKKLHGTMLLVFFGMVLVELINMTLFSGQGVVGVLYTVVMRLTYFVLPLFWVSEDASAEDYQKALLCYVAGVILGGSVLLYMSVEAVGWDVLLEGVHLRLGSGIARDYVTQTTIRTGYNSNQLAIMYALVVAISIAMTDRKQMKRLWTVLLIVYSAFVVFLTKSRTGILLLLGIAAVYYWVLTIRRKKVFSGTVFFLSILLLVGVIFYYFPNMAEDLLNRFREEDITNGRDSLMQQYLTAWCENAWVFLFGYGIGSYTNVVTYSNVPHNMVADILISWGTIGMAFICIMLIDLYRCNRKRVDKVYRLVAFLPAFVDLVAAMSSQYLSVGYPHMRLCFLILASRAFIEKDEKA